MNIMNERWRKLNANMHQYVPFRANMGQHCSLSAVQRKTAFPEQSWWPEFDMFGSMPWWSFAWHKLLLRLTPKNCYKVYSEIWSMSLHPCFRRRWLLQVCLGKAFPQKHAFVDISVFCRCASNARCAQGQPKKEFHRTSEAIAEMNADWKVDKAQYAEFNVPTCGNIAVWQLCRERQPFWNSHDGLNLTCLDQCHGVCSHGTNSSRGWRQRIVKVYCTV